MFEGVTPPPPMWLPEALAAGWSRTTAEDLVAGQFVAEYWHPQHHQREIFFINRCGHNGPGVTVTPQPCWTCLEWGPR